MSQTDETATLDHVGVVAGGRSRPPLDRELLDLTNAFRTEHQACPLQWHRGLARIAEAHAHAVAEGRSPFSHAGARGRFSQCETRCINIAENLARSEGFGRDVLPKAVVGGWCQSEGHRRNVLGPFDVCGIGFAASDGGTIFVTQLLALVDEDSGRYIWMREAAVEALTSSPALCAAAAFVFHGPAMALVSGAFGGVLEKRVGFRASTLPWVVRRKAANMLIVTNACAHCGAPPASGELFVSSCREAAREPLCARCFPRAESDADIWTFVA